MSEMFNEAKEVMKEAAKEATKLEQKAGISKGGVIGIAIGGLAILSAAIYGVVTVAKKKSKEYVDMQPGDIYGVEQDDEETEE